MWSANGWYRSGRSLETDYDDAIHQVIDLRRALDILVAQPEVDPERIAYVGHDFGAMYGSVLMAVDKRPMAYVFIAGASNFNKWMLFGVPSDTPGLDAYKARMDEFAPTRFVALAAPAPILFQFAQADQYVPREDAQVFYDAASEPKEMKQYRTGHAMMDLPEIQADRLDFLRQQFDLS
jgi:dienelactone hydrolase